MTESARARQQAHREEAQERNQRGRRAESTEGPVGVVLAGAGARGAYEAGVLAELLVHLDKRGERPSVFVGTSAGAINTVLFASLAHLPADEAAKQALAMWRSVRKNMVLGPFALTPFAMMRHLMERQLGIRISNPRTEGLSGGLLDTRPLRKTLEQRLNWDDLHANIRCKKVTAVAVAATVCGRGGTTDIFVETPVPSPIHGDEDRAVRYRNTELKPAHVLASSAIPVLFPPVHLQADEREDNTGCWYIDGGARLNAPIMPAIKLDAAKVVVIAAGPAKRFTNEPDGGADRPPAIEETFVQLFNGAMTDRMIEDLATLNKINDFVGGAANDGRTVKSRAGREYKTIDSFFGGPEPGHMDELGQLAHNVLTSAFTGVHSLRSLDLRLASHLLGRPSRSQSELLSYVLFEPEFIDEAIQLGQRDARRILGRVSGNGNIWDL
jgi:NTE family protein